MRRLPEPDPGLPDSRSAARYLFWLVRRSRLTIIVAALLAIIWMGCQALAPAMVGLAVDAAVDRDGRRLAGWALLLFGVGTVQAVTGITRHRFAVTNWLGAAFRTVQVVVRQANRLGSTLPKRLDAGEVVAIGTSDISHIGSAVDLVSRGIGSLLAVGLVTALLLRISVPLGMIVLIGVPIMMLVVGLLIGPLHRRQRAYRRLQGRLTGQAADLVSGLRVLRGVGGEPIMAARYRAASQQLRFAGVRTAKVEALRADFEAQLGEKIFLIANEHEVASSLAFYMKEKRPEGPAHPPVYIPESQELVDQFSFWHRYDEFVDAAEAPHIERDEYYTEDGGVNPFMGRTALYITDRPEEKAPSAIKGGFEQVEMIACIDQTRRGMPLRQLRVFACRRYRSLPL